MNAVKVSLTNGEFRVLKALSDGKPHKLREIHDACTLDDQNELTATNAHLLRLRRKVEEAGLIFSVTTINGKGRFTSHLIVGDLDAVRELLVCPTCGVRH